MGLYLFLDEGNVDFCKLSENGSHTLIASQLQKLKGKIDSFVLGSYSLRFVAG